MSAAPPPTVVTLSWQGDLRFEARAEQATLVLDGERRAGPSPMQALALGLAGCMAMDVVDILRKGRHPVAGLEVTLTGERAAAPPRRFLRIAIRFRVSGEVPADRVERALALSRERYCSVWHSLRPDIELRTSFEVGAAATH